MERYEKIVDYYKWCCKCEYFKTDENKNPCNECLTYPTNLESTKPIKFKSKEGKSK